MSRFQRWIDGLFILADIWPMIVLGLIFAAIGRLGPGTMSTGDYMAFYMALTQVMMAAIGLSRLGLPILEGLEQYDRVRPILEAIPEYTAVQAKAPALGGSCPDGKRLVSLHGRRAAGPRLGESSDSPWRVRCPRGAVGVGQINALAAASGI